MDSSEAKVGMLIVSNGNYKQSNNRLITDPDLKIRLTAKHSWNKNTWVGEIISGYMKGVSGYNGQKKGSRINLNIKHFKPAIPKEKTDSYPIF